MQSPQATSSSLLNISRALASRQAEYAASLAEVELAAGNRHPLFFTARGLWRAEQGEHQSAVEDLRSADALSAPTPSLKSALGVCLTRLGQFDQAIAAFDQALALNPNSAALLCRKGWALELAQELVAARQAHLQALALSPDNPEILGRLAFLASRSGAWAEARDFADRALRLDPQHLTPLLALATAEIEAGDLEAAERRLSFATSAANATAHERSLALGLLGDLRDRQDRVAEAFAAFRQAKLEARRAYSENSNSADVPAFTAASQLLTYYKDQSPRRFSGDVPISQGGEHRHVFLLGFPRSGTTLLQDILGAHPDVTTLEEKDPLGRVLKTIAPWPQNLPALDSAPDRVLEELRSAYWAQVRAYGIHPAGKTFVDKGPIYTMKMSAMFRLFPRATILFSIRDPRDVVLSCFRRRFGMNSTTAEFVTLQGTARLYDAVMHLAEIYRRLFPLDLHEVRHEDLVQDFDGETRKICNALGLTWQEGMRDFSARSKKGAITTASAAQIAKGLNQSGFGQWHRYEKQMADVLPLLQPWVERFGYAI